jgi:Cu/Ag efflux protein CusF
MRAWKVVVLVNLALGLGLGGGYLWWGRQVDRLERDLAAARAAPAGERQWQVAGVVRAVLPELDIVILTHDEIPGLMPPMTMGFRTASPRIREGLAVGDAVRFTLRGVPPNVVITAIEKTP